MAEAESSAGKTTEQLADSRRRYVTDLFSRNLVVGDKDQLAEDLKQVPYASLRGSLDIFELFKQSTSRVKKNSDLGVIPVQTKGLRGFLARLRFL